MGFDSARVDWALKATRNSGLQAAMDHVLANSEIPIPEANEDDEEAIQSLESGEEAKSIKCSECGKVFRSSATASFHAEKSGHQEFEESTEEIKPLTEEEKKAKLAELRQKLAEKRAKQSKEDVQANKANEALRMKAGQDVGKMKEDMEAKEAIKEADRKKREKLEDQRARAAIKAQIEADKKERAEKSAREKAIRDGNAPAVVAATTAKPSSAVKSSENPETRLQVRTSKGPITKTFPSDSTLVEVAEWVCSEDISYDVGTIRFSSTFPRKQYAEGDMKKSLKENGLTPSAVLMAQ